MCVIRESLSICLCASFSFGFKGRMWDLILLIPDHCLSIYFKFVRISFIKLCRTQLLTEIWVQIQDIFINLVYNKIKSANNTKKFTENKVIYESLTAL